MTAYEIIMIFLGVLDILVLSGGLLIALLTILQSKKN